MPGAIIGDIVGSRSEDAIDKAISIGGGSDTIGAIAGEVAGVYYGISENIRAYVITVWTPAVGAPYRI